MRKLRLLVPVLAFLLVPPFAAAQDDPPECTDCGNETYGTTIQWMGSPAEAAKKAKEEKKLVFVLHVSGNFEDPKFT